MKCIRSCRKSEPESVWKKSLAICPKCQTEHKISIKDCRDEMVAIVRSSLKG